MFFETRTIDQRISTLEMHYINKLDVIDDDVDRHLKTCAHCLEQVGNNVYTRSVRVGCSFPACPGESVKFQTCLIFL